MSYKLIIFISLLFLILSPSPLPAGPLVNTSSVNVFENQTSVEFTKYINKTLAELQKINPDKVNISKNCMEYFNKILPELQKVKSDKIKNYSVYSDKSKDSTEVYKTIEFKVKQFENIIEYSFYYNKDKSLEIYAGLKFDTKKPGDCKLCNFYFKQSPSGMECYGNMEYYTENTGEIKSSSSYYNKSGGKEESYNKVTIKPEQY